MRRGRARERVRQKGRGQRERGQVGRRSHSRPIGAVGVGAAVGGVLAALPRHPTPHLHRDACLGAPPDGAAELLGAAVWWGGRGQW